jgi:hypothetical protein
MQYRNILFFLARCSRYLRWYENKRGMINWLRLRRAGLPAIMAVKFATTLT